MGKGSQAKVYFVLYLAIVVELLIIIVERDEAEELLHRQNNETMKIVESILSQLYSGSGSEGINTKPQDEITLPAESDMAAIKEIFGGELKTYRQYQIDVGVTDVTSAIKRKEGEQQKEYEQRINTLMSLANVEDLECQVFFIESNTVDSIPSFQTNDYIRDNKIDFMEYSAGQVFQGPNGENWKFVGATRLSLDKKSSIANLPSNKETMKSTMDFKPYYNPLKIVGQSFAPKSPKKDTEREVFFYSDSITKQSSTQAQQKRSFIVNFEPPDRNKAGIYKLRFASKTNRILGVAVMEPGQRSASDEETKVNIGTVQLTVKDLKKVAVQLKKSVTYLDPVLSVEELAASKGTEVMRVVDQFNKQIAEAKRKAESDKKDPSDMTNKVRLYEYVARLVTPGQSVNFDQNRSDFDINVRVQTAKPSTADPSVSMVTSNFCFDNAKHVFQIEATPYKTNGVMTGSVRGAGGNADIIFTDEKSPIPNGKWERRGTLSKELPQGDYVMIINYTIGSKTGFVQDTLRVYQAGINDETAAKRRISSRLYYGKNLAFDFLPKSGNKIPASQFETVVSFDNGKKDTVNNYKVIKDNKIDILAGYKDCNVELFWVQPITYTRHLIYSTGASPIRLEEPAVNSFAMDVNSSGTANKVKVMVSGITILRPETGLSDDSKMCSLTQPEIGDAECDVKGYQMLGSPRLVSGDPDNGYVIEFELTKKSGSTEKKADGTVTIPITVIAKHPTNGVTSKTDGEALSVSVKFTPGSTAKAPATGSKTTKPQQQPKKK